MLRVYALPDTNTRRELWGSRVVIKTDKDGKHPYLYAYPYFAKDHEGKPVSYGYRYDRELVDHLSFDRYLYSVKDLKKFKSAVRLRYATIDEFAQQYGFVVVAFDPDTMQEWYVCTATGRLTD